MPKTVVSETQEFVGAGPETMLLQYVKAAATNGDTGSSD